MKPYAHFHQKIGSLETYLPPSRDKMRKLAHQRALIQNALEIRREITRAEVEAK